MLKQRVGHCPRKEEIMKLQQQIQEQIVEKLHKENRKLSHADIERIIQETIRQIEQEENEELSKTVMGTD